MHVRRLAAGSSSHAAPCTADAILVHFALQLRTLSNPGTLETAIPDARAIVEQPPAKIGSSTAHEYVVSHDQRRDNRHQPQRRVQLCSMHIMSLRFIKGGLKGRQFCCTHLNAARLYIGSRCHC
jgi:hypothetical protein